MKEGGIKKGMGCFTIPFALIVLPIALFLVILPFFMVKNGMAVSYRGKNRQCDIYPCVYLSFALCLLWCVCAVTQVHGQGKESQKRKPEQSQCRTASHDKGQYRFEQSL